MIGSDEYVVTAHLGKGSYGSVAKLEPVQPPPVTGGKPGQPEKQKDPLAVKTCSFDSEVSPLTALRLLREVRAHRPSTAAPVAAAPDRASGACQAPVRAGCPHVSNKRIAIALNGRGRVCPCTSRQCVACFRLRCCGRSDIRT